MPSFLVQTSSRIIFQEVMHRPSVGMAHGVLFFAFVSTSSSSVCASLCGPTPGPAKCSSPWLGARKRQEAPSLSSLGQECAPVARYDSLVCIRTKCKLTYHFISPKCSEVMRLGRYRCGARMWCLHSMPNIYWVRSLLA